MLKEAIKTVLIKIHKSEDDTKSEETVSKMTLKDIHKELESIISPKVHLTLKRHLFQDHDVPGIGNYASYANSVEELHGTGLWLDCSIIRIVDIGKQFGHKVMMQLNQTLGKILADCVEELGHQVVVYRTSANTFMVHADKISLLHRVLRITQLKLDQIPPISGVYKVALAAGIGDSGAKASINALEAKALGRNLPPEQADHVIK